MSRTALWDGFLEWYSKKYPDVLPSELSGKKMRKIEEEYITESTTRALEEATKDVEINEFGEIVSEREGKKGVRLKPHTFYG